MSGEIERLSIADAAARLGVSVDTVRRKLKRGQLKAQRDNHGQWWVEIQPGEPVQPTQRAAYVPTPPAPDPHVLLVEELRSQISSLRSMLDAAYAREGGERERHAAEIARLEGALAYAQRPWWRKLVG